MMRPKVCSSQRLNRKPCHLHAVAAKAPSPSMVATLADSRLQQIIFCTTIHTLIPASTGDSISGAAAQVERHTNLPWNPEPIWIWLPATMALAIIYLAYIYTLVVRWMLASQFEMTPSKFKCLRSKWHYISAVCVANRMNRVVNQEEDNKREQTRFLCTKDFLVKISPLLIIMIIVTMKLPQIGCSGLQSTTQPCWLEAEGYAVDMKCQW